MRFRSRSRRLTKRIPRAIAEAPAVFTDNFGCSKNSAVCKTVGWVTAGMGALAIGLFVGRELRQRYKFNRRTPYDFYAHSGDEADVDFGLGI